MKSFYSLLAVAVALVMFSFEANAFSNVVQGHFRWRNDNGSESGATYRTAEDMNDTLSAFGNIRLRMELYENGGSSDSRGISLYYSPDGSSWTQITNDGSSNHWKLSPSPNFADGDGVSNQLSNSSSNGFEGGNMYESSSNPSISLDQNYSKQFEFSIAPTGNTVIGTNYYFQVQGLNGYDRTPQLFYNYNGPIAITEPASNLTSTSVTLNGSVNTQNISTTARFLYGTSSGVYTDSINAIQNPFSGTGLSAVSADVSSLTTTQTYYYTVEATNSNGTMRGDEKTFFTPDSIRGFALSLNGTNNTVSTSLTNLSGDEITIEYWFKGSNLQSAVRQQNDGTGDYIVAGWSWPLVHILSNDGGAGAGIPVGANATDGNWHHVAMTWKINTTNGFNSYLDGKLVGSRNSGSTPIPNMGTNVYLGSYNGAGEFTSGTLEEVRVWSVARSESEVQHDMTSSLTGSESGLLGYWRFNEGTGTTTADATVNGNTGTLLNGPTWVGSDAPFPAPFFTSSPSSLNFGNVNISSSKVDSITVTNNGGVALNISSVGTSDETNYSVSPTSANLNPSASQVFYVTFAPTSAGTKASWVSFTLNASGSPSTVNVSGNGGTPPHIGVSPDSLNASLNVGDTTTQTLTISNTGENDLSYNINFGNASTPAMMMKIAQKQNTLHQIKNFEKRQAEISKLKKETVVRHAQNKAKGKLTAALKPMPKRALSAQPRILTLNSSVNNIDAVLTNLGYVYTMVDDIGFAAANLYDYDVLFLGAGINTTPLANRAADIAAWVNAGGGVIALDDGLASWFPVSVTAAGCSGDNVHDTDPSHPLLNGLDDVTMSNWSSSYHDTYTAFDPSLSVVAIGNDCGGAPILLAGQYGGGRMVVTGLDPDYHYLAGNPNPGTFIVNTITWAGGAPWLYTNSYSGTIPADSSTEITITFDARNKVDGDYAANILINSNDLTNPAVTVPAHMHVSGTPVITVSDTGLDFGNVFVTYSKNDTLTISNTGSANLNISGVASSNPLFTLDTTGFVLEPGKFRKIAVIFSPTDTGLQSGTLTIASNDTTFPSFDVPLSGVGVLPPVIGVSPTSMDASLILGDTTTQTLVVSNTGGSDLTFNINIDFNPVAALSVKVHSPMQPTVNRKAEFIRTGDRKKDAETAHKMMTPPKPGTFANEIAASIKKLMVTQSVIFYDNMENGMNGWTTQNYSGGDLWHQTQTNYNSPTNSWWDGIEGQGNYANGQRIANAVISPSINLNNLQSATLEFYESYETEGGYDYCMVDVSTDGGDTWTQLRGYAGAEGSGTAPSGSSGGWVFRSYSLDSYVGKTIQIRFYFDTIDNFANGYAGWFFDDVLVNGQPQWLSASQLSGTVPAGGSAEIAVTFRTAGLSCGDYNANIVIASNDPATPSGTVPAHLRAFTPPHIGVSPSSLDATLYSGDMTSQTLTISNSGCDPLAFSIKEYLTDVVSSVAVRRIPSPPRTNGGGFITSASQTMKSPSSVTPIAKYGTQRATKTSMPQHQSSIIPKKTTSSIAGGFNILLLGADNCGANYITNQLLTYPDIATVDFFETQLGTPTFAQLQNYDAVMVWNNNLPADATALGDVLADYVDAGGGAVLGTFVWSVQSLGRIMDPAYTPLIPNGDNDHYSTANMVILNPSHAIMNGVSSAGDIYRDYTTLTSGSELIATWDDGENFVAAKGSVVAINSYVGDCYGFSGDIPLIVHNSLVYVSGKVPWLGENLKSGTIPGGGSVEVTVTFNAANLSGGDYYAYLGINSNDASNPFINVPAHLHVNGAPNIVLSDTSHNFGNVYVGVSKPDTITVSNNGNDTLRINNVGTNNGDFTVDLPVPVGLAAVAHSATLAENSVQKSAAPKRIFGARQKQETNWKNFAQVVQGTSVTSKSKQQNKQVQSIPPNTVISDASGDAPFVDITTVSAVSSFGYLYVVMQFATTVNPADFGGALSLDVDQNASTGCPPSYTSSFGFGGANIGVEYEIGFFNLSAGVVTLNAGCLEGGGASLINSYSASIGTNSIYFSIPLADLGSDDGTMNVSGVVGNGEGPTDWFPNFGHGVVKPPMTFTVAPGGSQDVIVTFTPCDTGTISGTIAFENNDPNHTSATFSVTGHGLIPPTIGVSPSVLDASLYSGDMTTQTLTISNTGDEDLTFSIEKLRAPEPLPALVKMRPLKETLGASKFGSKNSSTGTTTIYFDPKKYEPSVMPKGERVIRDGAGTPKNLMPRTITKLTSAAGLKVLLAPSDGAGVLTDSLLTFPDIASVDYFYTVSQTPTLAQLLNYDVVMVWSNSTYGDPTALGNVLADYVDAGGGVVISALSWYDVYSLAGRIMDTSYTPLISNGNNDHFASANMVILNPTHPIMNGVSSASTPYRDYTSLTSGAELIAKWDDDENYVAAKGHIVAVNCYPETYYTGDVPRIIHNSLLFASGVRWLADTPATGTVAPRSSAEITVTFNAAGLTGGDYYANLVISSNDVAHPTVFEAAHLGVTDAAGLVVASDTAFDFGSVVADSEAAYRTFTVSNNGSDSLSATVSISNGVFLTDSIIGVGTGATGKFFVTFSPHTTGPINGMLTITSNDPTDGTRQIALHGVGVQSGGPGSALQFTAPEPCECPTTAPYVEVADNDALDLTTSYTIEAWIRPSSFNWLAGIVSKYQTSGSNGYILRLIGTDPYNGIGFDELETNSGILLAGQWYHIAAVNDNGTRTLYVNGMQVPLFGTAFTVQANSDPLRIGVDYGERYFNGTIDEVRIWNVARTVQEVRENMHLRLHGNEAGLAGYWRFDEGSGAAAYDGSLGGNAGTLINGPAWVTATEPLGTGSSSSVFSFMNGTQSFSDVTLLTVDPFSNPTDITVTQITTSPDSLPLGSSILLDDRYWVVDAFVIPLDASASPVKSSLSRGRKIGEVTPTNVSLTFTVPASFTNNGAASPSLYTLYERSNTSDGAWSTAVDHGDSLTSTSVSYSGIGSFGQFALGTNDPLPIQLAAFTATVSQTGTALAWTTISEINNYGFYVERRNNGNAVWTTVSDLIPGAGTSLEQHNYSFSDSKVTNGTYFYRIRQVDLNGGQSYSHEIKVIVTGVLWVQDETAPRQFALKQNYPNPFNPSTTIKFSVDRIENVSVVVYNMLGQVVVRLFDGVAEPGHYYRTTIDASRLASGMYFYRIVTDSHTDVKKMLLMK